MSNTNNQVDHRELTQGAIKERIRKTKTGDRVLFNKRVEPLRVIECPGEMKEWEIDFTPDDFQIVTITRTARRKQDLPYEEGDEVEWQPGPWEPPYRVSDIYECQCTTCKDLDEYELLLEGPQGGEYLIKNRGKEIGVFNVSSDSGFWLEVFWFQNQDLENA